VTAAEKAGLKQIDHLITTHYHTDHFGGAEMLATFIPIKNVYDNGEFDGLREKPDPSYRNFACDKRHVLSPGDEMTLKQTEGASPLKLRCLAARQKFIAGDTAPANTDEGCAAFRPKDRDNSDNANSIVMILEFGGFRFFDAGDLTWNMEQQLICPKNLVGGVDVYQVTHHGLDVSNNPAVIRTLAPVVAVMNNGVKKGCMPETFKSLKSTKSIQAIYQMHKNLREDREHNTPDEFIANLEEKCMGESLKLSVTPDGKSYTLEVRGNKKTFTTRAK
jgi:beta-lactamase superfamily II metal-dependent hydrolase